MGVAVAALALSQVPDALVGVFYDDGIYLALARSLAEGGGYRLQYLPGEPAGVHYPFLYPAFLAVLWRLGPAFPDSVALFKSANAVLLGLFAALAAGYLGPRLGPPRWSVALALAVACTTVPLLAVTTVLFAEPLFLVLAVAACWCADAARGAEGRRGVTLALAAGALAGLAALTRSIGVAVAAGVVLALFVGRRRQAAAIAAGTAAVLLLPWQLWSRAHQHAVDPALVANYGTYGQFLAQGGTDWISPASLAEAARPLAALTMPGPAAVRFALGLLTLGAVLVGLARLLKRAPAAGLMLCAYTGIVALWPYAPDRFVWAALPWLAAALVAGVHFLWRADVAPHRRNAARLLAAVAAASVLIGLVPRQVRGLRQGAATAAQRGISATMNDILPWIRQATDTSAVIAGEDEALIWLYTGRRAVPSYLWRVRGRSAESFGADTLRAWLERSGATHLVITGPGADAAPDVDALLGRYPGLLTLVRVWPGNLMAFQVARPS